MCVGSDGSQSSGTNPKCYSGCEKIKKKCNSGCKSDDECRAACSDAVAPCFGECDLCGGFGNQNTGCFTFALTNTACVMPAVADNLIATSPYTIATFEDVCLNYEEELAALEAAA